MLQDLVPLLHPQERALHIHHAGRALHLPLPHPLLRILQKLRDLDHLLRGRQVPGGGLGHQLPDPAGPPPRPNPPHPPHVHPLRLLHQPPQVHRLEQSRPVRRYPHPYPGKAVDLKTAEKTCAPFVTNRDLNANVSFGGIPLTPDNIAYPCGF